jgi:hypothetical protein
MDVAGKLLGISLEEMAAGEIVNGRLFEWDIFNFFCKKVFLCIDCHLL